MREIIFRGKRIENNEWVYGDLIQLGQSADYWYIMPIGVSGEMYEDEPYPFRENDVMCRCALSKVNPSTVGQYTGLKDKNGKMIFEGDIVKLVENNDKYEWSAVVEFGNPNSYYSWGWQLKPITKNVEYNLDILCWIDMDDVGVSCEVIGNIFDNKLVEL